MNYKEITPFKWFVLQNFPFIEADFDAITNYELLCKIVEYLNKTITATNDLGKQVEDLNNWFNNLDIQDEVDNKLDEMVEDNTLAEIINEQIFNELNTKVNMKIDYVDTFSDLITNTNLSNNTYVKTLGYYQIGDGGDATYFITDTISSTVDNYTIIELQNNLYAILEYKDKINVKQFGAKGDNTTDDLEKIQDCLNYTAQQKIICYIPAGNYILDGQLLLPSYSKICGDGRNSVLKTKDDVDLVYHTICTLNANSINARLARNNNSTFLAQGYPSVDDVCTFYVHDIILKDFTVNGNWQNRDLNNWDNIYVTSYGNINREPGSGIELQRCYNIDVDNLYIINSPQHNLNLRAGAYCYNEGITVEAQYPSYNIAIKNVETNNQRYDDGITTHDSEYITIQDCYVHVDNNINNTYTQAISNGIEIDDGSRYVNVINCLSRYNINGFQSKGHNNTPSAHDILFENCFAEYCHHGYSISGTSNDVYNEFDNMTRNIILNNCTSKNMYIFSNDTDWPTMSHDIDCNNATSVTINNFTSIIGIPESDIINNISNADHQVTCRFRGTTRDIKIIKAFLFNLKSLIPTDSYFHIDGTSRNFVFKDITADGYEYEPLILYNSTSQYGYCIIDGIYLSEISEDTTIVNDIDSNVQGTRTNMILVS